MGGHTFRVRRMKNIEGEMAALSKTAVGPIWFGTIGWSKKWPKKTYAAMPFSLFPLDFKQKLLVVMVSFNFC